MRSVTGLTGSGSRDWIIQRLSAVLLAVYLFVVVGWMMCHLQFDYTAWVGFMKSTPMKVFGVMAIISTCLHAYVGVWTILTDYVKNFAVRTVLQLLTVVATLAFTLWGFQIFWG